MSVSIEPLVAPEALRAGLGEAAAEHLEAMLAEVGADPARLGRVFPAAARRTARGPLPADATDPRADGSAPDPRAAGAPALAATAAIPMEDAVRVELAGAAARGLDADALLDELRAIYRYGDADEKRAVLQVLNGADDGLDGRDLLLDALRTNDTRLVGAAMGPHAARLHDDEWRHGVLKCLFTGVGVAAVCDLAGRADVELGAMAHRYAREREAAGRAVGDDVRAVLAACPDHPEES